MSEQGEPFTGTWSFDAHRSELSTPFPLVWVQEIFATRDEIVVYENIVRANGVKSVVQVAAKFDGSDYPISGFPIADSMAYKRINSHSLSGTGKLNGVVSLNETVTVTADGQLLTLIYSVQTGSSPVSRGVAVFKKDAAR